MAKSGQQRYPGASTRYWFQSRYGGDAMESNVIVWHTTEGTSVPSYSGGAVAPNFTALPDFAAKCLRWYQHFDFDVSSRALENHAGGVETNTLNVCQVEIVGTCDPATHRRWGRTAHLYSPDLPGWAIRDLAAFARWAHDHHGVPLTTGVGFKAYPGSYGSNGVRMSSSKWNSYRGHCGHQHVPENVHGDPGALPIDAILSAAKGGTITTEEDPMAGFSKQDIYEAVWEPDKAKAPSSSTTTKTNPTWAPVNLLRESYDRTTENGDAIRTLAKKVEAGNAAISELAKALASRDEAIDVEALIQRIEDRINSIQATVTLDVADTSKEQ